FFTGMLNKRLGQVVLKYCGHALSESVGELSPNQCLNIACKLKNLTFKVTGNTGFLNSQVTAGGISTDEFYKDTLMSKKYPGLFACGELLDVDGDCGGFNLAWAWSSGITAAESAVKYIGDF
ncbi:MAG: NAD(P)/FAD-dependent oxidoreductase, partial [Acutalibacteraceae bacterium]|nr:NAD(P)/FAD-dependent oxidoreductase [Acutalibacteraceae bacterium]